MLCQSVHKLLTIRPCAGVLCGVHESCSRYQLIDGSHLPSEHWLGRCTLREGDRPGFIPADFVGPPSPFHFHLCRRCSHAGDDRSPQ